MEKKGDCSPAHTLQALYGNTGELVCSSLSYKTLMISKSLFIHFPSAEERTHVTELWGKWFKSWEKRKISVNSSQYHIFKVL